jgi:uncharacterized protein YkwD
VHDAAGFGDDGSVVGSGGTSAATGGSSSGTGGASSGSGGSNSTSSSGTAGADPNTGGSGTGGAAGTDDTGGAAGSDDTGSTGGTSSDSASCSVTLQGASGDEPGELIPVCCAPDAEQKANVDEVFRLLNEHRMANGLSALAWDPGLAASIQGHCQHMAQHSFFDHAAPESSVSSFGARARHCGANATGENIAAGQATAEAVMTAWKNSSGHNQNMLNARYTRVGIGEYHEPAARPRRYWGQVFGR